MERCLLQLVAEGDPSAVERCIDRYGGLIWSLARRLVGAQAEVEDAVQEVFIELWRAAGRFDPEVASEIAFVAMIARRRLIDSRRRLLRRPDQVHHAAVDEIDVAADSAEHSTIEIDDEVSRAAQAIDQLRPDQQRMLRLSLYDGWSHQRIADHLQVPLGTVKTNLRRGLMRVRDLIRTGRARPLAMGVRP